MSNVWRMLYWYCGWCFGRDSYEDKRIEAEWYDRIVVRDTRENIEFAEIDPDEKQKLIDAWANEPDDF